MYVQPYSLSLPSGEMGPWSAAPLLRGVGGEVTMASPLVKWGSSIALEEKVRGHAYFPTFLIQKGWV